MKLGLFFSIILATFSLSFPAYAQVKTLQEALVHAYQLSPFLKAEQARLRAVDEKVSQAVSGWRPSVDLVGNIGKSQQDAPNGVGEKVSTKLNPKDVGISLTQPIFSGFKTTGSIRSSEALVLAGRAKLLNAEQQLLFDAAQAYHDVILTKKIFVLNTKNEQVLKKQFAATRDRYRVGELKKTDVSQAELRYSAAQASLAVASGDLANKKATFFRLVGEAAGDLEKPVLALTVSTEQATLLTLLEKNNPSIQSALYSFDASSADVTVTDGSLLPEVSLIGSVNRKWDQSASYQGRYDSASIMARVTVPLYRSGADYSRAREARQVKVQSRLELEDIRRKVREEAVSNLQEYKTAEASILAHQTEVKAANMALEGVKEEAKMGTRTTLDVLNAEQETLNAKINLARAEHSKAVASLGLMVVAGNLTAKAMSLPIEYYDPTKNYDRVHNKWIGF